jgi:hypothetical protein
LIMKDEKVPFCLTKYRRASNNGRFTLQSKQKNRYESPIGF